MKRRGYDIGRVVDLIFEYWLGRMKDSELEEYRHMKETTGLDKYAREFEDREWIKNALEEPDIFETDKAYRRFWSMTAGKRSIGRLRWKSVWLCMRSKEFLVIFGQEAERLLHIF